MNATGDKEWLSNARLEAPAGQMSGYVTDPSGAVIPNARITVTAGNGATRAATTDNQGRWLIAGLPSGNYKARADAPGFATGVFNLNYNAGQPSMYAFRVNVGAVSETVEVSAAVPQIQTDLSTVNGAITALEVTSIGINGRDMTSLSSLAPGVASQNQASANVMNLQKRVAGVLPVAVDVPRAGTSFSFVRPLVLDEETKVTFSYRSR
jgi:hypothetical protein